MLTIQKQSKIVPKMMKMADGRLALVYFLVSLEGGEIKARVISVKYTDSQKVSKTEPLALCGKCEKIGKVSTIVKRYSSIVSPYSSLKFFVSQPTRAPSFSLAQN